MEAFWRAFEVGAVIVAVPIGMLVALLVAVIAIVALGSLVVLAGFACAFPLAWLADRLGL